MANNTTLQNEHDLYSVLPLRDDEIRVIQFDQKGTHPSTTANTLSGKLRVLALPKNPKFVALSYSWGSNRRDESHYSIQICESGSIVEISIPETAYQAISDVRDHYEGELTLWIDSVCINQNDTSEKEIQIPLMREIYSKAEIVYAHLGRTESTDDAFDWMTHISQRGHLGVGILGPGGAAEQSVDTLAVVTRNLRLCLILILIIPIVVLAILAAPIMLLFRDQTGAADLDAKKLLSINSLLNRPWIQRAWTWQELVLARKAVIICGSKALAWDRFLLAISVVELCCQHLEKPSFGRDPTLDSMMGRLVVSSSAYQKANKHFLENQNLPNLGNLKSWCFLAECWLRFGRTSTINEEEAPKRLTFLDYHFKIYSNDTNMGIWFGLFFGAAVIAGTIILKGYFSPAPLLGVITLIGFIIHTINYIRIGLRLREDTKDYCELPMAFAIIPVLRTRKATDPRDICYGFYGVLQAEGLSNLPSPNYQKDPRTVFGEFFLYLIQWERKALVLLLDCCNYEEPSWSPDWQEASRQSWLDEAYFFGNSATSATPASVPFFDVTDNKLGLFVYGTQVGQAGVVWTGRDMVANDLTIADADVNNLSILLEWIQTGLRHRSGQATSISLEDQVQIFEALEKEVTKAISTRLFRLPNGFATWLRVIEPYAVGSETPKTEIAVQQDADISTTRLGGSGSVVRCYGELLASGEALEYHRKICNSIAHQRRLFIHSGPGRFRFGAGSLPTKVDDIVCLISGLPVPMILRKAGVSKPFTRKRREGSAEAFLVIGPAFIPGMMKGEMWPRRNQCNNTEPLPKDRMKEFYLV